MVKKIGEQDRENSYSPDSVKSSWVPQLQAGSVDAGNYGSMLSMIENNKVSQAPDSAEDKKAYNDTMKGAVQGGLQSAQSGGGLGGAMTSAGSSIGIGSMGAAEGTALAGAGPAGWAIMGGGLLLSAHEKKKQEEAAREQERINNEMLRRQKLIDIAMKSSDSNFSLV